MLKTRRRKMREIRLVYGVALAAQLVQRGLHVDRIPDDHRIGDHIETHGLIGLGFVLLASNHPFIPDKQKIAERV